MSIHHERVGAPLRGLKVVTLADDVLPSLGKAFADLGADVEVLRLGDDARPSRPLRDLLESRGKTLTDVDAGAARDVVLGQLEDAHAVVVHRDTVAAYGVTVDELADSYPHLVIAVLSDFGLTGERAGWLGSEAVFKAVSGTLSRSGEPGKRPLLQPGELFTRSAALHIAWVVLGAVYRYRHSHHDRGCVLDCAIFESGASALDPAYGMSGSGTPDIVDAYDRPAAGQLYPIFRVKDGFVRTSVLAKAQWLALLEWMGNPEPLMDEELLFTPTRQERAPELIIPRMQEFLEPMSVAEIVDQARRRKIPVSAVLSVGDVLTEPHFVESGVLTEVGSVDGRPVITAEGMATINGVRTVPHAGARPVQPWPQIEADERGPFPLSGVTVLDLGVIVAGSVVGQLFAELGARVIRLENTGFPDGMRRSFEFVSPSQARGHRGKESVGLDLRTEEGRDIFCELVRSADVVSSNFKPGTVERLGIAFEHLVQINPRIVCVESSAFGTTGPWSTAMGYGPLVRAGAGHTWLWRESPESEYFADGITIFPDHLVGRVCAVAALACLLDRGRTGHGGHITVAQSDVGLVQINEHLAAESVAPGSVQPPGVVTPRAMPEIVLPCSGKDQWVVVDPQTDAQVAALAGLVGAAAGAGPEELQSAVESWLAPRGSDDAVVELQAAGVPAARMLRVAETPFDSGLLSRDWYATTTVQGPGDVIPVERFAVVSEDLALPVLEPMPPFGQHTRSVLAEAGCTDEQIDDLFTRGIAQSM